MLLWTLASCGPKPGAEQGKDPIARVKDVFLYRDDIADLVPEGTSKEDSLLIVNKYIDNWIHETLVLQKAEKNLADEQKNFRKLLEDYRRSLIIHAYEEALVSQNLDTTVTDAEIEQYYKGHPSDFELKDNIINVTYVKVKKNAPKLDKLRQWYRSDNEKDMASLKSYCLQFAENYFLDSETWLLFDDLLKEIPIKMYDKELFLQNNRFVEVQDSLSYYFVNIKGFKIKNSLSPLSFEKENIRSIILNRRKLELIGKMKEDVYTEGVKNKEFEVMKK
jgi:hypothetical protein